MLLDKDKIKESLTEAEINKILMDLGSLPPQYDRRHGYPIYTTVCHGGSRHKLYYFKESQTFHCYTECGDTFDIYELVIRAKRTQGMTYTFTQALYYVAGMTGKYYTSNAFNSAHSHIIDDWTFIDRYKTPQAINVELTKYDKHVLDVFLHLPHELWLDEGISAETMDKYDIGYYIKDDRIIMPHLDIDGNLVGIRGRALLQEVIEAGYKYMPITVGNIQYAHHTMFNLYGLYYNKEAIRRMKKCLIFESEKSVLKCEDFYKNNNFTVATCGSTISTYQRDLILKQGVQEVFIAYDKEYTDANSEEAYKYAEKIKKLAYKFAPYVKTYVLWDTNNLLSYKDSPADKGKEVLEQLMKEKYEIKTLEGERDEV